MTLRAALLARERRVLIGVVHLGALPGAPRFAGSLERVLEAAAADARALEDGGADAAIVENFGDAPFFAGALPPETIAAMALALRAVREAVPALALGVNCLRNDARGALGLCASAGASFLRVNVHTGAAVTDQGVIEGRAAETLRERARLAPDALILADVHVKHATPLGGGAIADAAEDAARRGLADALIVTGRATGAEADLGDLRAVRERLPQTPLLVGSGATAANAARLADLADGVIAGTWIKRGADVREPVDAARVARLRDALDAR